MIVFACVVLAFGLLAYIFVLPSETTSAPEKSRVSYLRERKEVVYENLRDLNFEYKAGKLPDSDYLPNSSGSYTSSPSAWLSLR